MPGEETNEETPLGNGLNDTPKQEEASFTADKGTPFELEESKIVSD